MWVLPWWEATYDAPSRRSMGRSLLLCLRATAPKSRKSRNTSRAWRASSGSDRYRLSPSRFDGEQEPAQATSGPTALTLWRRPKTTPWPAAPPPGAAGRLLFVDPVEYDVHGPHPCGF